ncbi:MarR family winged helix-turn-helix transcriptional regulator [Flexibacterium corallicola]|uniref:MarR family winged helix-turn-helix transcriptional regulator n=1 Tax=Flexibacterium corallicola TaxID=3037259 RepID=UPI00286F2F9D|nr:MarR family transcriptional regulator [Pseudovibrio sp. M1P-2-3]
MQKKRTIHEVALRLHFDVKMQLVSRMAEVKRMEFAPQQLRAMRHIWHHGQCTSMDLVKTLKRDKGQISRIIDELCKDEMVERIPNPEDKRSRLLILSQKGYDFFAHVEAVEAEFSEAMIKNISPEELEVFFSVSDRISENLKNID